MSVHHPQWQVQLVRSRDVFLLLCACFLSQFLCSCAAIKKIWLTVLNQLWIWTQQTSVRKHTSTEETLKSVRMIQFTSQPTDINPEKISSNSFCYTLSMTVGILVGVDWLTLIKSLNSITKRDVGYLRLEPFKRCLSWAAIHEWISSCWLVKITFMQD